MQLGTRWAVGAEAPSRLPDAVVTALREVEAEIADLDTASWRWTLTWLEGRPIGELDDGTVIRYDAAADAARVIPAATRDGADEDSLDD